MAVHEVMKGNASDHYLGVEEWRDGRGIPQSDVKVGKIRVAIRGWGPDKRRPALLQGEGVYIDTADLAHSGSESG